VGRKTQGARGALLGTGRATATLVECTTGPLRTRHRAPRAPSRSWLAGLSLGLLLHGARARADDPTKARDPGAAWPYGRARVVSLAEALTYAQAKQPSLQAALERVRAAQADAQIPRARWRPGVGVLAELFEGTANNSTASYLGVPEVPLPRIGGTPVRDRGDWTPAASSLVGAALTQELFDFGRIAAQSAAADAAVTSERYRAEAERLAIRLVVKESYFAVQGAKAVLRAARDAYERTRVHRDLAAAGVKSGLYAPIELTRAEADLARFAVNRSRAEGGLASAEVVLAAAVGVPDRMLDAEEPLASIPSLPPLAQAITESSARDPVLLESRGRLAAQQALARAIAAETRPELLLSGTLSGRAGGATPSSGPLADGAGFLPEVANWDLGLILRWPIVDPTTAARAKAAAARAQAIEHDVAAVTQSEVAAIQRAYVETQVATLALTGLQRSVDAAQVNYAQAEARWKAGLGTALELADAEYLRTDAEIQLAGGRFDLARARAVLGKLLAEDT
jgi:outer membrane protein